MTSFSVNTSELKLFRKEARRITKRLEFECVARWVIEEKGGLLSDLARKSDAGLNDELDAGLGQSL